MQINWKAAFIVLAVAFSSITIGYFTYNRYTNNLQRIDQRISLETVALEREIDELKVELNDTRQAIISLDIDNTADINEAFDQLENIERRIDYLENRINTLTGDYYDLRNDIESIYRLLELESNYYYPPP